MLLIDKYTAIDNIYDAAESIICAVEEENTEIAEKIVDVRDAILKKIQEQPTIVPEVRHGNGCSYCKGRSYTKKRSSQSLREQ